jgi:hypothetical protein
MLGAAPQARLEAAMLQQGARLSSARPCVRTVPVSGSTNPRDPESAATGQEGYRPDLRRCKAMLATLAAGSAAGMPTRLGTAR